MCKIIVDMRQLQPDQFTAEWKRVVIEVCRLANIDTAATTSPKRKREPGETTPNKVRVVAKHQWGAILKLRDIKVPDPVRLYISHHGTDAAKFLQDPEIGRLSTQIAADHDAESGKATAMYATHVRFSLTRSLERDDKNLGAAIRVFLYLSWSDALDLIDRQATGRRLTGSHREYFVKFLDLVAREDGVSTDAVWLELNRYIRFGRKMARFAEEFGVGSLLLVAHVFSYDL